MWRDDHHPCANIDGDFTDIYRLRPESNEHRNSAAGAVHYSATFHSPCPGTFNHSSADDSPRRELSSTDAHNTRTMYSSLNGGSADYFDTHADQGPADVPQQRAQQPGADPHRSEHSRHHLPHQLLAGSREHKKGPDRLAVPSLTSLCLLLGVVRLRVLRIVTNDA